MQRPLCAPSRWDAGSVRTELRGGGCGKRASAGGASVPRIRIAGSLGGLRVGRGLHDTRRCLHPVCCPQHLRPLRWRLCLLETIGNILFLCPGPVVFLGRRGDQHDGQIVEYFLTHGVLAHFTRILSSRGARSGKLAQQGLQTLSILVQNVSTTGTIYYIFSNNHLNDVVAQDFDFSDDEILGYYVGLLKAIALRLNVETLQFFFFHPNWTAYSEAFRRAERYHAWKLSEDRKLTMRLERAQGNEVVPGDAAPAIPGPSAGGDAPRHSEPSTSDLNPQRSEPSTNGGTLLPSEPCANALAGTSSERSAAALNPDLSGGDGAPRAADPAHISQSSMPSRSSTKPPACFPLFTAAAQFVGHRDAMVRAAVRTIALCALHIKDPDLDAFLVEGRRVLAKAPRLQHRSSRSEPELGDLPHPSSRPLCSSACPPPLPEAPPPACLWRTVASQVGSLFLELDELVRGALLADEAVRTNAASPSALAELASRSASREPGAAPGVAEPPAITPSDYALIVSARAQARTAVAAATAEVEDSMSFLDDAFAAGVEGVTKLLHDTLWRTSLGPLVIRPIVLWHRKVLDAERKQTAADENGAEPALAEGKDDPDSMHAGRAESRATTVAEAEEKVASTTVRESSATDAALSQEGADAAPGSETSNGGDDLVEESGEERQAEAVLSPAKACGTSREDPDATAGSARSEESASTSREGPASSGKGPLAANIEDAAVTAAPVAAPQDPDGGPRQGSRSPSPEISEEASGYGSSSSGNADSMDAQTSNGSAPSLKLEALDSDPSSPVKGDGTSPMSIVSDEDASFAAHRERSAAWSLGVDTPSGEPSPLLAKKARPSEPPLPDTIMLVLDRAMALLRHDQLRSELVAFLFDAGVEDTGFPSHAALRSVGFAPTEVHAAVLAMLGPAGGRSGTAASVARLVALLVAARWIDPRVLEAAGLAGDVSTERGRVRHRQMLAALLRGTTTPTVAPNAALINVGALIRLHAAGGPDLGISYPQAREALAATLEDVRAAVRGAARLGWPDAVLPVAALALPAARAAATRPPSASLSAAVVSAVSGPRTLPQNIPPGAESPFAASLGARAAVDAGRGLAAALATAELLRACVGPVPAPGMRPITRKGMPRELLDLMGVFAARGAGSWPGNEATWLRDPREGETVVDIDRARRERRESAAAAAATDASHPRREDMESDQLTQGRGTPSPTEARDRVVACDELTSEYPSIDAETSVDDSSSIALDRTFDESASVAHPVPSQSPAMASKLSPPTVATAQAATSRAASPGSGGPGSTHGLASPLDRSVSATSSAAIFSPLPTPPPVLPRRFRCRVSFAAGDEQEVELRVPRPPPPGAVSASARGERWARDALAGWVSPSLILATRRGAQGAEPQWVALACAPLAGARVKADPRLDRWLHMTVRPPLRGLMITVCRGDPLMDDTVSLSPQYLTPGHWVLAFRDGSTARKATEALRAATRALEQVHEDIAVALFEGVIGEVP